jgi:hypothetical protein
MRVTMRMRDAGGWRAMRPGIALGLAAVLAPFALSACDSSPGKAPGTASVRRSGARPVWRVSGLTPQWHTHPYGGIGACL